MIETTDFKEKEQQVNTILSNTLKNEITEQINTTESNIQDAELSNIQNIDNTSNTQELNNPNNAENNNSPENPEESSSEPNTIELEDANTTNCLALTIQKDHTIVAVKNVIFHSIRMTWKVIASAVVLTIIKLFS